MTSKPHVVLSNRLPIGTPIRSKKKLNIEIMKMFEACAAQDSYFPWASLVVLVEKITYVLGYVLIIIA